MTRELFMTTANLWRTVRHYYPGCVPTDSGQWLADEDTGELLGIRVSTTNGPVDLTMIQLAEEWRRWVTRYEPTQFERIVTADGTLVRNRETDQRYQTSMFRCSCESFASQEQAQELLRQFLPDFSPCCKHMRFLRELAAVDRVTVLYYVEPEEDRLTTWVIPSADPIKSFETGHLITPGQVGLYYIGRPAHLPTIQSRCLTRGWQMQEWQPYGVPVLR